MTTYNKIVGDTATFNMTVTNCGQKARDFWYRATVYAPDRTFKTVTKTGTIGVSDSITAGWIIGLNVAGSWKVVTHVFKLATDVDDDTKAIDYDDTTIITVKADVPCASIQSVSLS